MYPFVSDSTNYSFQTEDNKKKKKRNPVIHMTTVELKISLSWAFALKYCYHSASESGFLSFVLRLQGLHTPDITLKANPCF